MRSVDIIANPCSGGFSWALVAELAERCEQWVDRVYVQTTRSPGSATEFARRSDADVIVTVGGDGTAGGAAAGLLDSGVPLFIVPAGTANSYYRALWGDRPWQQSLDLTLAETEQVSRRLDLARLVETGSFVLAGACAGFPPQAIHEAASISGRSGRDRYDAALRDLVPRFEPYPGKVLVDGREVHQGGTLLASVGGSRYRGGTYELLPFSSLDDGLLDVCVIDGAHPPGEILRLTREASHVDRPGVVYERGRSVVIERTDGRPLWFEHDGEVLLDVGDRFTLEVVPEAVSLCMEPS